LGVPGAVLGAQAGAAKNGLLMIEFMPPISRVANPLGHCANLRYEQAIGSVLLKIQAN